MLGHLVDSFVGGIMKSFTRHDAFVEPHGQRDDTAGVVPLARQ